MPLTIHYRSFEFQWQKIATKKQNIMLGLRIELRGTSTSFFGREAHEVKKETSNSAQSEKGKNLDS
jgi:hypothetical protein